MAARQGGVENICSQASIKKQTEICHCSIIQTKMIRYFLLWLCNNEITACHKCMMGQKQWLFMLHQMRRHIGWHKTLQPSYSLSQSLTHCFLNKLILKSRLMTRDRPQSSSYGFAWCLFFGDKEPSCGQMNILQLSHEAKAEVDFIPWTSLTWGKHHAITVFKVHEALVSLYRNKKLVKTLWHWYFFWVTHT